MDKRTTFITTAAVTGVFLAGAAAVGANIGILNAADNGGVGELNPLVVATTTQTTEPVATSVEPQVIDVYIEDPVVTVPATVVAGSTNPDASPQQFAVDIAGTVDVEQTDTGVLLDGVDVADGWTWAAGQAADGELVVTFTSADAEFVFYASLADDGTISARVDQPIINVVQVPGTPRSTQPQASGTVPSNTASAGTPPSIAEYDDDDDRDHDDDRDDDRDDDDDHDEDDHDGGDDDD